MRNLHPRFLAFFIAAVCITVLSSFQAAEKAITGRWKWIFVTNAATGQRSSIKEMTMNMLEHVWMELREDGTCVETKEKASDKKSSSLTGKWKLGSEGAELSINMKDDWQTAKIVRLEKDTLEVEMTPGMRLSMVRE